LKARIRGRAVDEVHPRMMSIALIARRNFITTHHPPVANWFLHQFRPAAEFTNSIYGETVVRVANPDQVARLARGLKAARFCPTTKFHKAKCVFDEKDVTNDGSWVLSPGVRSTQRLRRLKIENG
jgi:hypothetical protein